MGCGGDQRQGRGRRPQARDDRARHPGGSQAGIQAANRLVSVDKVPAFVSAWSAVVKAIAPVANDTRTVQLSVGANSAEIARLGDYTYTTFPLAAVDITAVANYAAKEMGKKRAAVLYINNETGTVAAQIYRDVFSKAGGQVVAYEAYDPRASDWTGPLLKVRAAQPDIVHIQGLVADTPQVIAQMRQLGLTMPVSSYSAVYNPKLIEQLGKASEGVIATSLAPAPPTTRRSPPTWRAGRRRSAASRTACPTPSTSTTRPTSSPPSIPA